MTDCIFCKISSHEIPSTPVYEDEKYIAFNDLYPKATNHILVIPKKHIESFHMVEESDKELIKGLWNIAWDIVQNNGWTWCQLHMNSWKEHWQEVMHIHLHILNNWKTSVNW